jgi:hypothetical protein
VFSPLLLPPDTNLLLVSPRFISSYKRGGHINWAKQISVLLLLLVILDGGTREQWRRGGGWSSRAPTRTRPPFQVPASPPPFVRSGQDLLRVTENSQLTGMPLRFFRHVWIVALILNSVVECLHSIS